MDTTHEIDVFVEMAREVYDTLGSGFEESVYEEAMKVELRRRGFPYESQKVVEVTYKGYSVGEGYADLVVHLPDRKIAVELKAIQTVSHPEEQQLRNYLRNLSGVEQGLLINFGKPSKKTTTGLEIRGVSLCEATAHDDDCKSHTASRHTAEAL
jgi:GxxExxY protein